MQVLALTASGFQVLLPVNMVAQIVGATQVTPAEPSIQGMGGTVSWREYQVPILHTSELITGRSGLDANYERIVVLWPMKSANNDGFLSLTSMGPPRVVDIENQELSNMPDGFNFCLGAVQMDDAMGLIPDIEGISSAIYSSSASTD